MVQKVMDARRDAGSAAAWAGCLAAATAGAITTPANNGGGRRGGFGGTPSPEAEALQKDIDDNAPAAQIKAALAKYKASQKEAGQAGAGAGKPPQGAHRNRKPRPLCSDWWNDQPGRMTSTMNETPVPAASLKPLLDRMVAGRQLSPRTRSPSRREVSRPDRGGHPALAGPGIRPRLHDAGTWTRTVSFSPFFPPAFA